MEGRGEGEGRMHDENSISKMMMRLFSRVK
jgi:hypothetical protein